MMRVSRLRSAMLQVTGLFVAGVIGPISAASAGQLEYIWQVPGVGNWNNASNWSPAGLPGTNDPGDWVSLGTGPGIGGRAIVDTVVPSFNFWFIGGLEPNAAGHLEVRNGGSLRTTSSSANSVGIDGFGTLTVTGGLVSMVGRLHVNNGTVTHTGGRIETTGPTGFIHLGFDTLAEYMLSETGTLDAARNILLGYGATGVFTQTGGTLRARDDLRIGVTSGNESIGEGEYRVSDGVMQIDDELVLGQLSNEEVGGIGRLSITGPDATISARTFQQVVGSFLELNVTTGVSPISLATPPNLNGSLDLEFLGSANIGDVFPVFVVGGSNLTTTRFIGRQDGDVFTVPRAGGVMQVRISYNANIDAGPVANEVALTVLSTSLIGDVDLDGDVDHVDMNVIAGKLGLLSGAEVTDGDVNADGQVTLADIRLLQLHFGETVGGAGSPAAVPEPGTAGLVVVAALCWAWRRRSHGRRDR